MYLRPMRHRSQSSEYGQQRLLNRSKALVRLPAVLMAILFCDLLWESTRKNLSEAARNAWPWRLQLLEVDPAAGLLGVLAGLILIRLQLEKTFRPTIGYSDEPAFSNALPQQQGAREVYVHNGGPGPAVLESIAYAINTRSEPHLSSPTWMGEYQFRRHLAALGFADQRDYHLSSLGRGIPLVPASKPAAGFLIAAFSRDSVTRVHGLDVRIRVRDSLGDTHERVLRAIQSHDSDRADSRPVYQTWNRDDLSGDPPRA